MELITDFAEEVLTVVGVLDEQAVPIVDVEHVKVKSPLATVGPPVGENSVDWIVKLPVPVGVVRIRKLRFNVPW